MVHDYAFFWWKNKNDILGEVGVGEVIGDSGVGERESMRRCRGQEVREGREGVGIYGKHPQIHKIYLKTIEFT